jgi:hypothetical protein
VIENAPDGSDPRCPHPNVPEDEMRPPKLMVGVSVTCKDCGRTWTGAGPVPAPTAAALKRGQRGLQE